MIAQISVMAQPGELSLFQLEGTVTHRNVTGPFESDSFFFWVVDNKFECPWDTDWDDTVGFSDVVKLLANWGPCPDPQCCETDLDGDGATDFDDLVDVLANWHTCG